MIDIIHAVCGGICFRYDHVPSRTDILKAEHATLLDGSRPAACTKLICGTCGKPATINSLIVLRQAADK